jgi:hypothetical protein
MIPTTKSHEEAKKRADASLVHLVSSNVYAA